MNSFTEKTFEFTSSNRVPVDPSFFERLIRFYSEQPVSEVSCIWEGLKVFHAPVMNALLDRDPESLCMELENLYDSTVLSGLDWHLRIAEPDLEEKRQERFRLHAFAAAECLGAVRVCNPEQPTPQQLAIEDVLTRIEGALHCRLTHPGGGKMIGTRIGDRFVTLKMLDSALTIASLMRLPCWPPSRILEIGAGCGILCYLLHQVPTVRVLRYDIIDLPIIAVFQAYLLACGGLEHLLWLSGEKRKGEQTISIHGLNVPSLIYSDLIINQDSLPEIPVEVAHSYLTMAFGGLSNGGAFYSVNHESSSGGQTPMRELMREYPDMRPRYRSPYWGRDGYLEEVWERR